MKKLFCIFLCCVASLVQGQNSTNWTQLFLQWNNTQDNGGSGVVRSIRMQPNKPENVLIGAATAGIWRSSNNGNSYTCVSNQIPEVEWVNEIIFSHQNPQVVYAGTDVGVVKSLDAGKTWSYTNLRKHKPDKFGELLWIDVPLTSSDIIYATTQEKGIYKLQKSIDGGKTWTVNYQSSQRIWDMKVHPENPTVVYILEASEKTKWINFKKSDNSGKSFEAVINGFPSDFKTPAHRARLATTPANPSVIYIAIGYNGGGENDKISFFKSANAGNSFEKKCCGSTNTPLENAVGTTDFLTETCHLAQLTWNFAFTVSETDENVLACAANKIKISTDGGITWNYDTTNTIITGKQYDNYKSNNAHTGIHGDHHGLSIIKDNIWNSNDGGVYFTNDGGATVVQDKSNGLGIQELWGFSQSFKNDVMAVGLNHNQICYRDDRVYGGWIGVNGADAMAANVNPIDDQFMYNHPWGHERVKRSLTEKKGHEMQKLGIELGYITLDNLEFHPHNYYTIYGSDYGDRNKSYRLTKTTNNAQDWEVIKSFEKEKQNAVAVKTSFADANYLYAVVSPNRVIKSVDQGENWTDISPNNNLIKEFKLWRLAVSDQNPNHLWVSVKGNQTTLKVLHSKNGGKTWRNYSEGLPVHAIYSLIYQRGSDDILYTGTNFGIYYRKKNMKQWELYGTGMPVCKTPFMFINYAKGKIRVGTSRGIWENNLVELTAPKANITVSSPFFNERNPTLKFADYSVVAKEATYLWSFPGATPSSSTLERPTVHYSIKNGKSYDVTLTVTDARGTNTQTLKHFINYKPKAQENIQQ